MDRSAAQRTSQGTISVRAARSSGDWHAATRLWYEVHAAERASTRQGLDSIARGLIDGLDEVSSLIVAETGGGIVGALRVSPGTAKGVWDHFRRRCGLDRFSGLAREQCAFSSRFVVRVEHRTSTVVLMLALAGYNAVRSMGARLDFATSRPAMVSCLRRLGYVPCGLEYVDQDSGLLQRALVLPAGDGDWLRRCRSPLADAARRYPADPGRHAWLISRLPGDIALSA